MALLKVITISIYNIKILTCTDCLQPKNDHSYFRTRCILLKEISFVPAIPSIQEKRICTLNKSQNLILSLLFFHPFPFCRFTGLPHMNIHDLQKISVSAIPSNNSCEYIINLFFNILLMNSKA